VFFNTPLTSPLLRLFLKTLTIIDTFGFFFRSYYALPALKNSDGFPTGLLTGFINLIDTLKRDYPSDYIVFALDSKGDTFRHKLNSSYKAHRDTPPIDLIQQLPIAIDWIREMGFASLSKDGFEADDIIATVVKIANSQDIKVRILSHDKDLYQLISKDVILVDSVAKKEINDEACFKKFGVYPKDFINFQAIVGDTADNIQGVKGIGVKGASKLINQFGTIENIYKNLPQAGTPRIQKLLLEYKESLYLSRELVTLRDDVFKDFDFESFIFEDKNYLTSLFDDFVRFEMKQAIKKANNREVENLLEFKNIILNTKEKLFEVIDNIPRDTIISFDTETTGLDTKIVNLVGFSFSFEDDRAYYVPIGHRYLGVPKQISLKDALDAISKILSYKVIGQNLKFDLSLLYNRYNFDEVIPYGDSMILEWLIDSSNRLGLGILAKKYLDYEMKSFKEVVKKGEDFSSVEIDLASFYASEDALCTRLVYLKQIKRLESNLLKEAQDLEYPFINILAKMERVGIKVDQYKLELLETKLSETLDNLTQEIYTLSNSEFNIQSPKQLGVILFESLGLKGSKKTKTGYSTNEAVLKTLKDEHLIINKILEYRENQKILSTYIKPLLKLSKNDTDSRIYTTFIQTGTATGRLSSKEPNLQNIPVRSKIGRGVRDAFVAKDGYKLISIDYSQIELRLLAHFSEDKSLLNSFNNGEDIHLTTAIKLFGKDMAKSKRSFAKSINFGLLYGMGAKKLSEELSITQKEAKEIIKNYFNSFPTVKNFLEEVQDSMKIKGFVETINGRRRLFDYENANGMQKASFLRESTNTLFQGSSADIIKLAMLEIDIFIQEELEDVNMLLQIHDELIFEVPSEKVEMVSKRFKYIMENIIELKVPLESSVSIGNSWGELK